MCLYEAYALLEYGYYKHKDSWEQSRFISYMTAQVNSTKVIEPTSIMKFHWENQGDNVDSTRVTNEDKARLSEMVKKFENKNIQ